MGPLRWVASKKKAPGLSFSGSSLITLGPLNSWLARNVSWTLMLSNGLVNTVGEILIHKPIIRFTFSGRRITLFAPARLVDSWPSQTVEFSAAITRCSRVHIQIVTVWASMMGDIFSLPAIDTLRAFFFHYTIHIQKRWMCFNKKLEILHILNITSCANHVIVFQKKGPWLGGYDSFFIYTFSSSDFLIKTSIVVQARIFLHHKALMKV